MRNIPTSMRSYVATNTAALGRINEAWNLYVNHTQGVEEKVRYWLNEARRAENRIGSLLGGQVAALKMLEIGPGQQLVQLAYFARRNQVVGVDLDLIMQQLNLRDCLRMAGKNGRVRTCKTIVRKILGVDSRIRLETASQLGLRSIPNLCVLQMDAAKMTLPDDQFHVVFSRSVFEHLQDPGSVIAEICRVLKPGGVMFLVIHLFSSDSGCHDPRIFAGRRSELPFWSHLRPEHAGKVRSNSYLNKLTLADWRHLFAARMPGSELRALCDAGQLERQELFNLRKQGHLTAYSDEELLTVTLDVTWRKPIISTTRANN